MLQERATETAPSAALASVRFQSLERWTPLTGLLFVILVLVGGPVLEGSTPGAGATGARVIAFYTAHRERERAGAIVLAFAFLCMLCFAATLRARWRNGPGVAAIAALMLAAATALVVGQTTGAGLVYALTEAPARIAPSTAQTLNLLSNDLVLTSAIGFLLFGLTCGVALLREARLPAWLGWSAIGIGILFVIPPLEFAGFFLLVIWIAIVSVLVLRRPA